MLKWTPKAEDDLLQIQNHIAANFNDQTALSTILAIIDYCESTLNNNPLAGKILASNPLFSVIIFEGNSIYYCENPQDKNLYIVYVQARHTKTDHNRIKSAP